MIRASPIDGDVLSWQDPLYEGAVPANLDLNEVSTCRARYLSAAYPNERNQAVEIQERNRLFRNAGTYDQVILWFEHDLVDQLQLLQILDGFTGACPPLLDLICIDNHPGVAEFRGIGQLHPTQAPALMDARAPITDKQFTLAQAGWAAFRSPDPRDQLDIELFRSQRLSLTVSGEEVLEGKADATALKPVDHWLGGVHLRDSAPLWRWDGHNRKLIKTA